MTSGGPTDWHQNDLGSSFEAIPAFGGTGASGVTSSPTTSLSRPLLSSPLRSGKK